MSLKHYFASLVFLVGFCISGVCAVPMAVKNPQQVNLAAGTVLTVGVEYYASISANRTLTFTGTATEGAKIILTLDVTAAATLTIPTSYRFGQSSSTTSLALSPGNHSLLWIRSNSKWWLSDSAGPLNNLAATTAPTANEDSGDGYAVGSVWIDTTNDLVYQCVDATATAAVWRKLSLIGGTDYLRKTDRVVTFPLTIDNLADSMNYSIGYVPAAFTITHIYAVHHGTGLSSPSVLLKVYQGTDRSSGTAVVTAGNTVTSSTTGSDITTFDDATCPAGSWLWITTGSKSGTTDDFTVIVTGTYD